MEQKPGETSECRCGESLWPVDQFQYPFRMTDDIDFSQDTGTGLSFCDGVIDGSLQFIDKLRVGMRIEQRSHRFIT